MPVISILMCSRKRPELLRDCIRAFRDNAASQDSYEVLVAMDDDDQITREPFEAFLIEEGISNVRVFEFERMGWSRMCEYLNVLCAAVNPDTRWLCQWTDDQHIISKNWDAALEGFTGQFVLPWVEYDNDDWANATFPYLSIVPVEWFKTLGLFSKHRQPDWFISEIVKDLGLFRKHPYLRAHNLKAPDPETGKPQLYINTMTPGELAMVRDLRNRLMDHLGL